MAPWKSGRREEEPKPKRDALCMKEPTHLSNTHLTTIHEIVLTNITHISSDRSPPFALTFGTRLSHSNLSHSSLSAGWQWYLLIQTAVGAVARRCNVVQPSFTSFRLRTLGPSCARFPIFLCDLQHYSASLATSVELSPRFQLLTRSDHQVSLCFGRLDPLVRSMLGSA